MTTLITHVKKWFDENHLNTAVVGFSGGIDSTTTIALCHAAGIRTVALQANVRGQFLSSHYSLIDLKRRFPKIEIEMMGVPDYPICMYSHLEALEAALPILRVANFYAQAAMERTKGYKPVVVGTVNFDEAAYLGFWGKASDAAQDYYPISHLHKSEVYALAKELGVPQEIIDAVPSGDLQWSGDLNDYKMIGATYPQIEAFAKFVDSPKVKSIDQILEFMGNAIDDPLLFATNINKNTFKYNLPFPNVHADNRLEIFRKRAYPSIRIAATMYQSLFSQS